MLSEKIYANYLETREAKPFNSSFRDSFAVCELVGSQAGPSCSPEELGFAWWAGRSPGGQSRAAE